MSDVYDIWLYPLQDRWRTVNEMSDFMYTGQMGNLIFHHVTAVPPSKFSTAVIAACSTSDATHTTINMDGGRDQGQPEMALYNILKVQIYCWS